MNGAQEIAGMHAAGFTDQEISDYVARQWKRMSDAGFNDSEISDYFGQREPDMSRVQRHFDQVKEDLLQGEGADGEPRKAASIKDYLEAGWGNSVTGLSMSGKMPDVALSEDAPWYGRLISTAAGLIGDFPWMVMGTMVGSAAGEAVGTAVAPGPGTLIGPVVGAGGGAFALPAILREELIQNIRQGRIKDSRDFLDRALAISWEGIKGFVTGATTAGIGTGAKLAAPFAQPALNAALQLGAEVTTLTEMGAALEGRLPQPHEFLDAALLLGAMKAATGVGEVPKLLVKRQFVSAFEKHVAGKLQDIYAQTGKLPAEVIADAERDPSIKQDILSTDKEIPDAYQGMVVHHGTGSVWSSETPDLARVGSGEGAQAYGWGIYFAESKGVANSYAKALGQRPLTISAEAKAAIGRADNLGFDTLREAMQALRKDHEDWIQRWDMADAPPEDIRAIQAQLDKEFPRETLYSFTIPESVAPRLLDWDRPLSEQTPEVQEALTRDLPKSEHGGPGRLVSSINLGQTAGEWLKGMEQEADPEHVAGMLREAGIPGLRYLDQGSRAAGEGTSNYVIWDQSVLDRMKRLEGPPGQGPPKPPGERPTGGLPPGEPSGGRTPEELAILARIGSKEIVKGIDVRETAHRLYTDLKNDLHPLVRLTKMLSPEEGLDILDDPGKLAHLTRGSFSKADHFLEFSPFRFGTFRNIGKSMKAIMEPIKDDLDGFRAYAISRRSIEKEAQGIKTGIPQDEARAVVANASAKNIRAFNELRDYQRYLLDYFRDSGIINQEEYDAWEQANLDYIPFYRLFEDEPAKGSGPRTGRGLRPYQPIQGMSGSELKLADPIESVIKNTYALIDLAERNRAMQALVRLAENHPDGVKFLVPAKQSAKPTRVQIDEINKFLQKNGIEFQIPKEGMEALTVFRRGGFLKDDELSVFFDGKRKVYKIDPELARSINALDRQSIHFLVKALSIPAKTLRAGAVLTPDFMSRNLLRDQLHAFILSENGYVPFVDALRGMWSLIGRDESYQAWLKSGGPNAALVDIDRRYVATHVFKLAEDTGFMGTAKNVVKTPIELLRIASELTENATRLGEFKKVAGKTPDISQTMRGGFSSREVTLDFARIGAKTRGLNILTAFWNARLEGLDRVARGMKDHPARTTAKAFASITLPSILLWWANHDDPRWKDIPSWEKDLFWIIMTKDHIYRIPKPFEVGIVFGTIPERILDWLADHDPHAMEGLTSTLVSQMGVDIVPTAAVPVLEQWANKSKFTGGPLIPAYAENALPADQYQPYTTQLTRAIGAVLGSIGPLHYLSGGPASPLILDNYIRGWTGGLGNYVLQLADFALRKSGALPDPVMPTDTLADIPFVKAFVVRYPSAGSEPIQRFYDRYDKASAILNSIKLRAQGGDAESALKEYQMAPGLAVRLDGIHTALGTSSRFVRLIYKNPSLSADEKRQMIDDTYYQMIEMAKFGNTLMDEAKDALSE